MRWAVSLVLVRYREAQRACEVLAAAGAELTESLPPWTCPLCGQRVAGQWVVCWQCGQAADGTPGQEPAEAIAAPPAHLNNVMGEQDLNPLGFHCHPAGRRMPSMMAPSVVLRDGQVELVLGSAGSNRIRSALLQTIVGVVDHGLTARTAVEAPRVHFEDGTLYAEPGIDLESLTGPLVEFGDLNLFFGGVQAVLRRDDAIEGAGASPAWRGGRAGLRRYAGLCAAINRL